MLSIFCFIAGETPAVLVCVCVVLLNFKGDLLFAHVECRIQNALFIFVLISAVTSVTEFEGLQETLANELLGLTKSLKQNMTVAGTVIKEDTKVLTRRPFGFRVCRLLTSDYGTS